MCDQGPSDLWLHTGVIPDVSGCDFPTLRVQPIAGTFLCFDKGIVVQGNTEANSERLKFLPEARQLLPHALLVNAQAVR
jgi:hypothetical protein